MIDKRTYQLEHIRELQETYGRDPLLIERVLFAFGLLEALQRVGLPFVFKGGTSLMLILQKPMRLSTDIDIIVEPGIDIYYYIEEANKLFPFKSSEEQIRNGKNNIEKKHFKFYYDSPLKDDDFFILLDVLFEENHYSTIVEKLISNEMLVIKEPEVKVKVPNANCILGDKLTAFAPHTTGVGFNKKMEVIKQLFDVSLLVHEISNFTEVKDTYVKIVKAEIEYRGITVNEQEVLMDTIESCVCIIGRGSINATEYKMYSSGILSIINHIFGKKYSGEYAAIDACKVLCLAASVLTDKKEMIAISSPEKYTTEKITNSKYIKLNYMKKMNLEAFGYLVEGIKLLEGVE